MTTLDSKHGVFEISPEATPGEIAEQMAMSIDNLRALLSAAAEPDIQPSRQYMFACLAIANELKATGWKLARMTRD